jgi:hypothetical protein
MEGTSIGAVFGAETAFVAHSRLPFGVSLMALAKKA